MYTVYHRVQHIQHMLIGVRGPVVQKYHKIVYVLYVGDFQYLENCHKVKKNPRIRPHSFRAVVQQWSSSGPGLENVDFLTFSTKIEVFRTS